MKDDASVEKERPVVTTEPNGWMRAESTMGLGPRPEGSMELFFSMLTAPGVIVQELIDPQAESRTPLTKWVDAHERITKQFKSVKGSKDQRRSQARRRFWNENIGLYRQALVQIFGTADLPTFSDRELRVLLSEGPMTSLLSELFVTRFIDSTTKWTSNDLVDMFYLSCAAAYCDYVVGEVKTATQLQQIQRSQGKKVNVFSDLQSLVAALHADGLTTAEERDTLGGVDVPPVE